MPEGYIAGKRKEERGKRKEERGKRKEDRGKRKKAILKPECTLLKQSARILNIPIDKTLSASEQLESLWLKHNEFQGNGTNTIVKELSDFRLGLIKNIEANPDDLMHHVIHKSKKLNEINDVAKNEHR